jgi:hypothetical protein
MRCSSGKGYAFWSSLRKKFLEAVHLDGFAEKGMIAKDSAVDCSVHAVH